MQKRPRRFSTDIADYILRYGMHVVPTDGKDAEGADALVLETGFTTYEDVNLEMLLSATQYQDVVARNIRDYRKPIFFADIPTPYWLQETEYGYQIDVSAQTIPYTTPVIAAIAGYPTLALALSLPLIPMFSSLLCGYNSFYDKTISYMELTNFFSSAAYRSAVTAHKAEQFIAPEIGKRIGKKPTIYIEYGAAHCDIEPYLKHNWLRNAVIGFHKQMLYICSDKYYEDKVCELRPKESQAPISLENILTIEDECFTPPRYFAYKLPYSVRKEISSALDSWERIYYRI